MEGVSKFVVLTAFLVAYVSCAEIPVGKCKLDDSACLGPAFQTMVPMFMDGVPDWGVEVLDPMEMDDLAFDLSGLQFTLKEGKLKGLKATVVNKVKWDLKKQKLAVDFNCNASIKGHYTAAGRLLILPISGDGQMKLKLRNVHIILYIDFKMVTGEDVKKYAKPTKYEFTFDVKDGAHFNLTGLFNGNKELSDTMLNFLNENWKQVSMEFGRPMMDGAAKKLFKNVVAFFDNHPIEEIAEF